MQTIQKYKTQLLGTNTCQQYRNHPHSQNKSKLSKLKK